MPYDIRRIIQQIQALEPEQADLLHTVILARMTALSVSTDAGQATSIGHIPPGQTTVNVRALYDLVAKLTADEALDLQRMEATLAVVAAPFDEDSSKSSSSQVENSSTSLSSSSSDVLDFSSQSFVSSSSSQSESSSSSSSSASMSESSSSSQSVSDVSSASSSSRLGDAE